MLKKIKNFDMLDWFLLTIILIAFTLIILVWITADQNNRRNEEACNSLLNQGYETIYLDYICFIKTDVGWFPMNKPENESNYDALIPLLLIQ